MPAIEGIHHVTAIAGDPQENVTFYVGVMGMRLVKRSVNQDAPDTYHFFYADAAGHPGTDLTFFPWPDMPPGRRGVGLTVEVALAVPPGSLPFWAERLAAAGATVGEPTERFGERALPAADPHGLPLCLVETGDAREFTPWPASPVPAARQVRGLHGVRLLERDREATGQFLTGSLGFEAVGEEDGWHRFGLAGGGSGRTADVREVPDGARGSWGVGSVHHVAWRVPDAPTQLALRAGLAAAGRFPTEVIERFWFKSVYFKEPGGALFEVATDGPGFTADEDAATLGERLSLPPWLEPHRAEIERGLPPVTLPTP